MGKLKKIFDDTIGISFIILFLLVLLTLVSIFFGSIMKVFGFEYDSFGSVMLFFIILEIVDTPGDALINGFIKALLNGDLIGKFGAKVVYVLLSIFVNIITMLIVDYFMDSVTVSAVSILIMSIILSLIGSFEIGKEEDYDNDNDQNSINDIQNTNNIDKDK